MLAVQQRLGPCCPHAQRCPLPPLLARPAMPADAADPVADPVPPTRLTPALSAPQSKKIHEAGVGHKRNVEEFLKNTFSKGREERTEDKELQAELREIEEAALKSFETDLRKKGVENFKTAARQTMHNNKLSKQGVGAPRRDWGGKEAAKKAEEAAAAAAEPQEVPEWKVAQMEAARRKYTGATCGCS